MPTNLRIMAVEYLDDGRWFAEVWYGDRQIPGVVVTGQNGYQPWDVILDPEHPVWRPHIMRLQGVPESEIDWSSQHDPKYNSHVH